jgi:hypothetical protein
MVVVLATAHMVMHVLSKVWEWSHVPNWKYVSYIKEQTCGRHVLPDLISWDSCVNSEGILTTLSGRCVFV